MNFNQFGTLGLFLILSSCSSFQQLEKSGNKFPPTNESFYYGYLIADSSGKILDSQNSDSYFTPASTTKLYHSPLFLTLQSDSVFLNTGFDVRKINDSLRINIYTSGDPLLKARELDSIAALVKMDSTPVSTITLFTSNYDSSEFWGNGWMWDDEPDDYQGFLNEFPLDENVLTLHYKRINSIDSVWFDGLTFPVNYQKGEFKITRERSANQILISRPDSSVSISAIKKLFSYRNPTEKNTAYIKSIFSASEVNICKAHSSEFPSFSYKIQHTFDRLMQQILTPSSNFCSEQSTRFIGIKNGLLGNIKNGLQIEKQLNPNSKNRIVDGSGLSRYNLITPLSLFEIMKTNKSKYNIKKWFAKYGFNGTLHDRFSLQDSTIQVFAKSGSMTGVQNLAAFIFSGERFLGYAILYTNNTTEPKDKRFLFEKNMLDYALMTLVKK